MKSSSRPILLNIFKMQCPDCGKSNMFINKSIFPLNHVLDMPEHCKECGLKMEPETGFYFGTGYVSYAISLILFFINLVWYWLIFGIHINDNSVLYYLITSISIVIFCQPWIMRISRVIYLSIYVNIRKRRNQQ